jgi:ATP-dependent Clp protease adaptor protein ClpS
MDEPLDTDTLWDTDDPGTTTIAPKKETGRRRQKNRQPRYNVVLWDSDDHTFNYVEKMLRELFGHTQEACHQIAESVDADGRATVLTTTREHAELKRDQIHAYGKDHVEASKGSMWSTIEPVE